MKRIPLTQGKYATVDDEDYDWLMQWKWYANFDYHNWYAVRKGTKEKGKKRPMIRMHRVIMGAQAGQEIDHENGDGLDNQKHNLRFCTHPQNNYNRANFHHTSKYKGVSWKTAKGKWYVAIRHKGKHIFIGMYVDEDEAGRAYDEKAKELFGEFARPNNV